MSWIKSVPYPESTGRLRAIYDRIRGPGDYLDNILTAHGLRPHTLEGHMVLYKSVLHHPGNRVPKWLLETLGVYVSLLNRCSYCVEHHFRGLCRLLSDEARARSIREALETEVLAETFDDREIAMLSYAKSLTAEPGKVSEAHIQTMRAMGMSCGEILEVNQVVSYFAYANRTVVGLGVTAEGDVLGLAPTDSEPDSWAHR